MLTPTFITGVIEQRPTKDAIKQGYIGQTLFPSREVPERRLSWETMVAENNLAGVYSSKGRAIPGDDLMFDTYFANLVDVKAARQVDPDVVAILRDAGMPAVYAAGGTSNTIRNVAQRVQDHIQKRIAWCDDSVDSTLEYFAMQALTGTLVWPPLTAAGAAITSPMPQWNANETISISFGLEPNFIQNVTTLAGHNSRTGGGLVWTNASSNMLLDLEVIAQYMVEYKGVNLTNPIVIMSRSLLSYQAFNSTVLNWIKGKQYESPDGARYVDINELKNAISTKLGFTIQTYDAQWTYRTTAGVEGKPTINRVKFLKEGMVIIKSDNGPVGYMAQAPHEAQDGSFRSGKIPWVYREPKPPYEVEMGIGSVSFPVIENVSDIFVLNTAA